MDLARVKMESFMGIELILAGLITVVTAVTVDRVVLPSALSHYEKKVEKKVNKNRVYSNLSSR